MFNVNYRTADNLFNKIALATSNVRRHVCEPENLTRQF